MTWNVMGIKTKRMGMRTKTVEWEKITSHML